MILLDTDHVTALKYQNTARCQRLLVRLALVTDEVVGVAVVTVEEQMRGWLAAIAKERKPVRQIGPYRELAALFDFYAAFDIIPFDETAVAIFETFGAVQIGTMDKKIAAIALANNALLLTANRRDFEQVPGLRFENGMDEPPAAPSPPTP
jgi:tRNA(fMet)-specific endonuclease VapC